MNRGGVPMPGPRYTDTGMVKRDGLIRQFGLGTVVAAESAAILDIFIKVGIISESEYLDMVGYRCQQIDLKRQEHAAKQAKL